MDLKKLALAVVAAYIVLMGTEYVVHDIWLRHAYEALPDSWRPVDQMQAKMWIMWTGQFLFTMMFAYIYTRGQENKPWAAQGIRYGILVTLLAVIPYTLGNYVVYRVPHSLAVHWMIAGAAQMLLLGLVVAFFCKKEAA